MRNNYDPIAGNYDWLSRLVFRKNLILSQTCLLQHIPIGSKILIAGGGTGWILDEITKIHPSGLNITYVEISEKMIRLAKKRNHGENEVHFVHQPIEEFVSKNSYDIILTAYLFDNFQKPKAELVFKNLSQKLTPEGKWLFADFHLDKKRGPWWQKHLLKSMIVFFRTACDIEAKSLVPMEKFFRANRFREMYSYRHMYGFLHSGVYIKME